MAGGLFGTNFYLNPKCLIASFLVIGVYYLPRPIALGHRLVMCFLIGMSTYVALAWYDVLFSCRDYLRPTLLGYMSSFFKPPAYGQELENLPLKDYKVIRTVDIMVLLIILVMIIYPFIFRYKPFPKLA